MGIGHRHETGIGRLADQRVGAGEGDMVVQQHQPAGRDVGAQRAGRIGQDQPVAAKRGQHFQRQPHRIGSTMFVVVRPAAEDGDTAAFQLADDQLRHMTRHAGMGKTGQIVIGNRHALDLLFAGFPDTTTSPAGGAHATPEV